MKDHRITDLCPLAWDWIERAMDGTLDAPEQQRLREHLTSCADCAALRDDALAVRALVRAVPRPVCPPRAVEAVLARIDSEPSGVVRGRAWWPWRAAAGAARGVPGGWSRQLPLPGWARAGMAVAAAAVLLLVVPSLLRRGQPTPDQSAVHNVPRPVDPAVPIGEPLTAEERAQAQQAIEQARLALGVFARTLDRTSELAEQNLRASIGAPMRRALEPRRRPENQPQPPDRRTGVLPGAAWTTGKC